MNNSLLKLTHNLGAYIKDGLLYGFFYSHKDWTEQVILEFRRIPLNKKHFKQYFEHSTAKDVRGYFDLERLLKDLIIRKKLNPEDNEKATNEFIKGRILKWLPTIANHMRKK